MFIEPLHTKGRIVPDTGWIEVICGSMFSGKTEELIRRLNRAQIAKLKVGIFKPTIDKRYHEIDIVSHNENSILSTPVAQAKDILSLSEGCTVVGIDEVQFFGDEIIAVCNELANQGKRVIVAGLDMDFQGQPFGAMPQLLAIAEFVTKVHAVCMNCGDVATYSYRLTEEQDQVLLGETNAYEARCRRCFKLGNTQ